MCFFDKKVKTQQQQNKKSNIKTLAGSGDWTRDLLHPKRMRYQSTTELTDSINCSQAIYLLDAMGRNVNKQSQICAPDIFNKCIFFCNSFTCKNNYIWQFLIFTGVGFASYILLKCKI